MNKSCYCETCDKHFHPLGIATHRAMHRRNKQDCVIFNSDHIRTEYKYYTATLCPPPAWSYHPELKQYLKPKGKP